MDIGAAASLLFIVSFIAGIGFYAGYIFRGVVDRSRGGQTQENQWSQR